MSFEQDERTAFYRERAQSKLDEQRFQIRKAQAANQKRAAMAREKQRADFQQFLKDSGCDYSEVVTYED